MKGQNAERAGHVGREYWSRRLKGMWSWGPIGKWATHRKERRAYQREIEQNEAEWAKEPVDSENPTN